MLRGQVFSYQNYEIGDFYQKIMKMDISKQKLSYVGSAFLTTLGDEINEDEIEIMKDTLNDSSRQIFQNIIKIGNVYYVEYISGGKHGETILSGGYITFFTNMGGYMKYGGKSRKHSRRRGSRRRGSRRRGKK